MAIPPSPDELLESISSGDLARLHALIAGGADVNARFLNGSSPLLAAIDRFCASGVGEEVVLALVAAGADVNATEPSGRTPLIALGAVPGDRRARLEVRLIAAGARQDGRRDKLTGLPIAPPTPAPATPTPAAPAAPMFLPPTPLTDERDRVRAATRAWLAVAVAVISLLHLLVERDFYTRLGPRNFSLDEWRLTVVGAVTIALALATGAIRPTGWLILGWLAGLVAGFVAVVASFRYSRGFVELYGAVMAVGVLVGGGAASRPRWWAHAGGVLALLVLALAALLTSRFHHARVLDDLRGGSTPYSLADEQLARKVLADRRGAEALLRKLRPDHLETEEALLAHCALRFQGLSDAEIGQRPEGLLLVLTLLEAERSPPGVWRELSWLRPTLKLVPGPGRKLGLVTPALLSSGLARFPSALDPSGKDSLKDETLAVAIRLAGQEPGRFSQPLVDQMLQRYQVKNHQIGVLVSQREALRSFVSRHARDGRVTLKVEVPPAFEPRLGAALEATVSWHLGTLGFERVDGPGGLTMKVALADAKLDQVLQGQTVYRQETQRVRRTSAGKYGGSYYVNEQVSVPSTRYSTTERTSTVLRLSLVATDGDRLDLPVPPPFYVIRYKGGTMVLGPHRPLPSYTWKAHARDLLGSWAYGTDPELQWAYLRD